MANQQKYVSNLTVAIPPMTINGYLVGVQKTAYKKGTELVSICPDCDGIQPLNRVYTCPEHGKIDTPAKAKEVSKGDFIKVSAEQIQAATESKLPLNALDLTIHPAQAVDAQTFPAEGAYVFYPHAADKSYATFKEVIADPNLAFIGMCNLKHFEKLLKIELWGDNVVARVLMFPEQLNERTAVIADGDAKLSKLMRQLVDQQIETFDPSTYQDMKRAALAQLVESGDVEVAPKPSSKAEDLVSLLEATIKARSA